MSLIEEYIAKLKNDIETDRMGTHRAVNYYMGLGEDEYAKALWAEHHGRIQPMMEERDRIIMNLAAKKSFEKPPPFLICTNPDTPPKHKGD